VSFALSPDGTRLAFIAASADGTRRVWMRQPASIAATPVAGTEAADSVFWSPDGGSIAFFANGALKRLDLRTGAAVPVCTVQKSIGFSGTWSPGGRILFASVEGDAIYAVPTAGGTPTVEVSPDPKRGETRVQFPSFLPDGTHYLYLLRMSDGSGSLMLAEPGRPSRRIMTAESNAAYLDSGDLVFARGGTLVSQPFDPATATVSGEPLALADSVRFFLTTGVASFSASRSGTVVYQSQRNRARLAWVDRAGHEIRSVGTPGDYLDMRLAPSGQTVLLSLALPATGTFDVWTLDLQRDASTRVTLNDARTEFSPVMTPDGQVLLFSAPAGGAPRIVRRTLRTGAEAPFLPGSQFQTAEDISPDGRVVAFSQRQANGAFNIWLTPLDGPPAPAPFRKSDFSESSARFSPDGRLLCFISTAGGRGEVYVAPVAGGPASLVSSGAVVMAVWSHDGREILYLSTDRRLVSVPVLRTAPVPQFGAPVTLFSWTGRPWISFDVAHDGRSLLALIPDIVADEQPFTALLHWREATRR
jgi:WD40 repeat protein